MSEIWAKSIWKGKEEKKIVTLGQHILDILKCFDVLKKYINDEEAKRATEFAIVFHDVGKVSPSFQISVLGNLDYTPRRLDIPDFPHSIFSIFWIDEEKLKEHFQNEAYIVKFILSAVAFHHWRDNFDNLIVGDAKLFRRFFEKINEIKDKLLENLKIEISFVDKIRGSNFISFLKYDKEKSEALVSTLPSELEDENKTLSLDQFVIPPYKLYWFHKRIEIPDDEYRKWISIAGFLQRCDHFASWCEEIGENLENIEIEPPEYKNVRKTIELLLGKNIWQFQFFPRLKNQNLILVAPTGYGKTEFAFLWGAGRKIIYTLPFRVAVNQIFERAEKLFHIANHLPRLIYYYSYFKHGIYAMVRNMSGFGNLVELLHSDADLYILEKEDDIGDTLKTWNMAKHFSFPVIISTGDQFFPWALRPPGYEKVYSILPFSTLVIDEVQSYDPKACAIIVKFIEDTVRMGGKFLLMTATFPNFVREKLKEKVGVLPEINIYNDRKSDLQKIYKHNLKIRFFEISRRSNTSSSELEALSQVQQNIGRQRRSRKRSSQSQPSQSEIDKILSEAQNGKRVLVVVNTTTFAKELYKHLKDRITNNGYNIKLFLLHRHFTYEDRLKKEKEIMREFRNPKPLNEREGKILISTQVVEVSLDIDADILFTEIAPADVLVQRMGRVARRFFYSDGKIIDKASGCYFDLRKGNFLLSDLPNVIVWIFKEKENNQVKITFDSGKFNVYNTDLKGLTLYLLLKLKNKIIPNNMQKVTNVLRGIFNINQEQRGKRGRTGNTTWLNFFEQCELTNNQNLADISEIDIGPISEYEKYSPVNELYSDYWLQNHKYKRDFDNMLEILEAGYMSNRKDEAFEEFRRIFNIRLIPTTWNGKNVFDNLINDVVSILEDENKTFLQFKQQIISRYVIDDILFRAQKALVEKKKIEFFNEVEEKLTGYPREKKKKIKKLERWMNGIYFVNAEYNNEIGLEYKFENNVDERIF